MNGSADHHPEHSHDTAHAHGMDHAHEAAHSHGHSHGHSHAHAPMDFDRVFLIGIALNSLIVLLEAGAGFWSQSMALLADAGHNLSDVLALGLAWGANLLSRRVPTPRYTYGLHASSILAALFNAIFLLVVTGALSFAAIQRLMSQEPVGGFAMIVVAAIGMCINGLTAMLLASRRKEDLNVRGAFLHMLSDAAISAGVVVTGLVIVFTNWVWLDPLVSLGINVLIIVGTWDLLRESLSLSLAAVPASVRADEVRSYLSTLPKVTALHDLHIWAMSTSETALTAHLVMPDGHPGDSFLLAVAADLKQRYGIGHATLQIEMEEDNACALAPATAL